MPEDVAAELNAPPPSALQDISKSALSVESLLELGGDANREGGGLLLVGPGAGEW